MRPLCGERAGKPLPATRPDATFFWYDGRQRLRAQVWYDLVLPEEKPGASSVTVVAVFDPRYSEPWLLATNLDVSAEVVWRLYRDRWAVEHLPQVAKPLLGSERAFVFGGESRLRLPELALLAGNLLSYLAATSPAVATGFWDRAARPSCGRLRRVLADLDFSELPLACGQLRKKGSVTAHLPKGVLGHRRTKPSKTGLALPLAA